MGRIGEADEVEGLARRARAGDGRAMERLLAEVYPRVARWARTQGLGEDDVEDVTQAALIAAYRALPAFRFESRFETWLYRIVRRAVADWRRRQASWGRESVGEVGALGVMPGESADEARLSRVVRRAFEGLPARQREVFDLVELQGRSTEEVAELLSLAASTVRVHLLRARRAIRRRVLERDAALVEDRYGVQVVR
ncbi:MAG: RNA polymerase sigma factor [Longimicrobiales bacterium]